jgi:D-aminopeptidase
LSGHPISRREFLAQTASAALTGSFANLATKIFHNKPPTTSRRRLRDLGIIIGSLPAGKWNAITDVPGVKVGHCTRIEGHGELIVGRGPIRTGVTVVFPNDDIFHENVTAGRFVMNGNGEMTGLGSIDQRGLLQSPIFLTDTSNIGRVMNGAMTWFLQTYPEIGDTSPAPVPLVAETWAGFLHDVVGRHLNDEHVLAAIKNAQSGSVPEGAVGGGVGMVCYDFKGGIGTASRVLPERHGGYTIGVLVQANHGGREQLMINGVPVGKEISDLQRLEGKKSKSIILIGATNAPMIPAQLQRLCKRMAYGLARTGALSSHGSGDLLLFFSTGVKMKREASMTEIEIFNDEWISRAHQAAMEAAEEAILNSLCMAETTTGINGNTAFALPIERLPEIMKKYGRL